jgi:hypothetical protein
MPLAALLLSRVSRLAVLALLALPLAIPAAVFGEKAAADGWQLVPRGAAPLVRITSNQVVDLYPGVSKELNLTLHNSDSKHRIVVERLRVREVATTNAGCAPSRRNLAVRQYKGAPLLIPPNGARSVTLLLSMPNTVADACQRAVFRLRYRAEARIGKGHTPPEAGP